MKMSQNKTFQSWAWLIVLLIVWELVTQMRLVNPFLLPSFSSVVVNLISELTAGKLVIQILNSMKIILMGFLLSFALASIIAALCVWASPIESLFNMLSTIMSPLPAVALMPLIIMWFGINTGAMLAMIVHGVIWSLLRYLLDGMRSVPRVYREWGKNIGLPPWRTFTDIFVFAIMPSFLSGTRVGWARAWRALISAEMVFGMIGNLGGIGFYIYMARAYANIKNVMSGVIVIIIIGISIETLLFSQIEKHTIRKWGMTHE